MEKFVVYACNEGGNEWKRWALWRGNERMRKMSLNGKFWILECHSKVITKVPFFLPRVFFSLHGIRM